MLTPNRRQAEADVTPSSVTGIFLYAILAPTSC